MNVRSLKFRLVAWYAGWLTVLFVVFGIFVCASLDYYLEKSLRELLTRRAQQVTDLVQQSSFTGDALKSEIQNRFAPEANNRFTRVTLNGSLSYISGFPADRSFDPRQVPAAVPGKKEISDRRKTLPDGTSLLLVTVARQTAAGQLLVEAGASIEPVHVVLEHWVVALACGLAVLISAAIAGGFTVVQRALNPVDRIIQSAERISSRNLSERLPVSNTRDEIERLSTALNSMIRRLDEGFQQTQRFFADASHELRTPLTIIQGELETVIEATNKPDVREAAGSALEEVERLKNIVEGLFALSRLDAGEAQENSAPFDLGELSMTTADQMRLLAEDKKISVHCHASEEITIKGDRARLKQVVVNLLDNAIKYTPQGGRIEVNVTARNNKAVLEVSDNGIGIPREALPHLFERFFRVDKARSREAGGAGLGLSIVQSICLAHHGHVEVQSEEGRGSRFIVKLPLEV